MEKEQSERGHDGPPAAASWWDRFWTLILPLLSVAGGAVCFYLYYGHRDGDESERWPAVWISHGITLTGSGLIVLVWIPFLHRYC